MTPRNLMFGMGVLGIFLMATAIVIAVEMHRRGDTKDGIGWMIVFMILGMGMLVGWLWS